MRPDPAGPLAEAAARRHELTRSKAIQALRELDRSGQPVTFAGVAQAAGISRSWLYTQSDISDQIRRLRESTDGAGSAASSPTRSAPRAIRHKRGPSPRCTLRAACSRRRRHSAVANDGARDVVGKRRDVSW